MVARYKSYFYEAFPFFISVPAFLWPLLILLLPFLGIIYVSFLNEELTSFTLTHYSSLMNSTYACIILRSCGYAVITTLITFLIGYPVAYYVAFYVKRKTYALFFLTLPFWTNLIVLVYAWFFLLEKGGVINSFLLSLQIIDQQIQLAYTQGAVIAVMVYCYLPFMIMPLYTVLQKFNKRFLEASCDLGATYLQTLRYVIIPLSLSGMRTGLILVFVPSFGEFIIPALMGGGKELTVGSLISYYFIVSQNYPVGAAFSVIAGLFLLITVIFLYWILGVLVKGKW